MSNEPRTIETMEDLYQLPSGTILRSSDERHPADYWEILGDLHANCISAGSYSGPVNEISLPAIVLQPLP